LFHYDLRHLASKLSLYGWKYSHIGGTNVRLIGERIGEAENFAPSHFPISTRHCVPDATGTIMRLSSGPKSTRTMQKRQDNKNYIIRACRISIASGDISVTRLLQRDNKPAENASGLAGNEGAAMHEEQLTVHQCDELAKALHEDAAQLPHGSERENLLQLAEGYRLLAQIKRMVLHKVN
jgi:hypothetical protein